MPSSLAKSAIASNITSSLAEWLENSQTSEEMRTLIDSRIDWIEAVSVPLAVSAASH